MDNTGEIIKSLRQMTKLSQKKFGELYHIPFSTLQGWERGNHRLSPYLLEFIYSRVMLDFEPCPASGLTEHHWGSPSLKVSDIFQLLSLLILMKLPWLSYGTKSLPKSTSFFIFSPCLIFSQEKREKRRNKRVKYLLIADLLLFNICSKDYASGFAVTCREGKCRS